MPKPRSGSPQPLEFPPALTGGENPADGTDGAGGQKQMTLGPRHAGATFAPVTGGGSAVVLDETGSATFSVEGGDVRVYIRV